MANRYIHTGQAHNVSDPQVLGSAEAPLEVHALLDELTNARAVLVEVQTALLERLAPVCRPAAGTKPALATEDARTALGARIVNEVHYLRVLAEDMREVLSRLEV